MKEYDVYFIDETASSPEIAEILNWKATQGFIFIGRDSDGFCYFERNKEVSKTKKRKGLVVENPA